MDVHGIFGVHLLRLLDQGQDHEDLLRSGQNRRNLLVPEALVGLGHDAGRDGLTAGRELVKKRDLKVSVIGKGQ